MISKWEFITSPRFWALVLGAIAYWLVTDKVISAALGMAIETVAGGFIGIRTIDRFSEKLGAKVVTSNKK